MSDLKEKNESLSAANKFKNEIQETNEYLENFDILETITNVGNDEVFTPKNTVKEILKSLPEEVWHNKDYKWLNPATKTGIFEREIALKLDKGLENIIKDKEERRKHILQNMIFAIGQTRFTANVARRTLYYCTEANRKCDGKKATDGHYINGYAIGNGTWFNDKEGNIKTPKLDHEFIDSKGSHILSTCTEEEKEKYRCKYCGIKATSKYNDIDQREKYVYEFLHIECHSLLNYLQDLFFKGDRNMKFDIIIGNPPYQLSDGGAQASARPIYNFFVEQAKALNPKFISMIIPSRWMTGGKGLDEFRNKMINDTRFIKLHDFPDPKICFPNNDIKGGVCYFVWKSDYNGKCEIVTHNANNQEKKSLRYLKEKGLDIFIRNETLINIYKKVSAKKEDTLDTIVSARKPYGLEAETMVNASKYGLPNFLDNKIDKCYEIFGLGNRMQRMWKYLPIDYPIPKTSICFNKYKVFIAEAYGCGSIGEVPSTPVLSTPVLSTPGQLCTETFLEIGPFDSSLEASNLIKYIKTKFFRALVGIQKQTQHTTQKVYRFVPLQNFKSNSEINWDKDIKDINAQLCQKYNLDSEEIEFINNNIQEMI